ncbi:interferon-induced very large GTPase 1-like isoform X2 [Lampetra planeri]
MLQSSAEVGRTEECQEEDTDLIQNINSVMTNKSDFHAILCKLNLTKYYPNKLTLRDVLTIDKVVFTGDESISMGNIAMHFLRNIMRANAKSRTIDIDSPESLRQDRSPDSSFLDELSPDTEAEADSVSILDLVAAVFLCCDSLLQQVLMMKMSRCHFALPLLLPDPGKGSVTFLLWAMRPVVHKWRPHSGEAIKGYREDSMATTPMPIISFVRLGDCSVSKSERINSVLSNENHEFFVHRAMECGDSCRSISKGMVEMCFYLPCGESQLDLFPDIFTVLNLRGDIRDHPHQLQVLKRTSDAMFIFVENVGDEECGFLSSNFNSNSTMFLAIDQINRTDEKVLKKLRLLCNSLSLKQNNFCFMENRNEKKNKTTLQKTITDILKSKNSTRTLEKMATKVQQELNTEIDEYVDLCSKSRHSVDSILGNISKSNLSEVKAIMMPCQGELWHKWAELSREQCRSKRRGDQTCEDYTREIEDRKLQLRQQQSGKGLSQAMETFASAILDLPEEMKMYFLQSMGMELDALSRQALFPLRGKYQELLKSTADVKEELKKLSNIMSSSSLGLENFMREIGQIYEASKVCKSENDHTRLPAAMAELFLKGVPMELLDGDAGCIPIDWITDVFGEVLKKLGRDPRVFVLTVLGVQSSGKSTLLNTMFGLQFAVGSGRCTRGAFMQLLPIDDDLKPELGFDFLLVIDTEGLKSSELAKLDNSHEHDNELATVVIGLSDLTLINLSMENAEEMKEILQTVVSVFLKMSTGKKTHCVFVHQNSGDVSAAENNMQAKKELLDQLNIITEAVATIENVEVRGPTQFTDIINYDVRQDNWLIPGFLQCSSCMAPVSHGYSEKVFQLKRYILNKSKQSEMKDACLLSKVTQLIDNIWHNVKKNTFKFHFKNAVVSDGYNKLQETYSTWEEEFHRNIFLWIQEAEQKIKNECLDQLDDLHAKLKSEAETTILEEKKRTMEHFKNIFINKSGSLNIHARSIEDMQTHADHLMSEILNRSLSQCDLFVRQQKSNCIIEQMQIECNRIAEENVYKLLAKIKIEDEKLDEHKLELDFDATWSESIAQMPTFNMEKRDIKCDMENRLRNNILQNDETVKHSLLHASMRKLHSNQFVVQNEHLHRVPNDTSVIDSNYDSISSWSKDIIEMCEDFVTKKSKENTDYSPTAWDDLLNYIDNLLKLASHHKLRYSTTFMMDIKVHICNNALEPFTNQLERFFEQKELSTSLSKLKTKYLTIFTDHIRAINGTQNLYSLFIKRCLKPAFGESVKKRLRDTITRNIQRGTENIPNCNPKRLQIFVLKKLLQENDYSAYLNFAKNTDNYVKQIIKNEVFELYKKTESEKYHHICYLKKCIHHELTAEVKQAIAHLTKTSPSDSFQKLSKHLEMHLKYDLNLIPDFLQSEKCDARTFSDELKKWLDREMSAIGECSDSCDVEGMLKDLSIKPHEEIFKVATGCGEKCPLCRAPCDETDHRHRQHKATMHYPLGLFKQQYNTNQLSAEVCTTLVHHNVFIGRIPARLVSWFSSSYTFSNCETDWRPVHYSQYRSVSGYQNWDIPTLKEIPYFWKFVLYKHNEAFAEALQLKPAEIPEEWGKISKKDAEKDLQEILHDA